MSEDQAAMWLAFPEPARVAMLARLLAGESKMRRDDELLRKMMLDMEASPDAVHLVSLDLIPSDDDERAYFHMRLLADEGLVEEMNRNGGQFRMTMKGHDFVAAIRDDTIWRRTKEALAPVKGFTLSMIRDVAIGYIRQELISRGVPL